MKSPLNSLGINDPYGEWRSGWMAAEQAARKQANGVEG